MEWREIQLDSSQEYFQLTVFSVDYLPGFAGLIRRYVHINRGETVNSNEDFEQPAA